MAALVSNLRAIDTRAAVTKLGIPRFEGGLQTLAPGKPAETLRAGSEMGATVVLGRHPLQGAGAHQLQAEIDDPLVGSQQVRIDQRHAAREPFDLVICQGVLAYLSPADLKRALRNLGTLTRGALYLEVVTREDYENDIVDDTLTDPRLFRHRAEAYRRGLAPNFRHAGGGVWLSRDCEVPLYAMECADDA